MFLFLLFDVFDSSYKNGFADGFSSVIFIRSAVAVYAWIRKCCRFRADFLTFIKKAEENSATPYEIDKFENDILDNWCLNEAIRNKIISLLPPIRDYAMQSFQSRIPEWKSAVNDLKEMDRNKEFYTFTLFRKMPVRAACLAFLHAGWFGKD